MFTNRTYRARAGIAALLSFLLNAAIALGASAPMSISQVALYQGADREKILLEGAKREGQLTFYNSDSYYLPLRNWCILFDEKRHAL